MHTLLDEPLLLNKCLDLIEAHSLWGKRVHWENRHFETLSEQITAASGIRISGRTLRRLFGKEKNNKEVHNPQQATKNALAIYLGYRDWEDFTKQQSIAEAPIVQQDVKLPSAFSYRKVALASSLALLFILGVILFNRSTHLTTVASPAKVAPTAFRPTSVKYEGYFMINAKHSGKCMDVAAELNDEGVSVWQWVYLGGNNQKWRLEEVEKDYFKIEAKHSHRCLEVKPVTTNGANIQQSTYVGKDNQKWRLEEVEGNYYRITNKLTGLSITVADAANTNGLPIVQWEYFKGDTQKWKLVAVKEKATAVN